MALPKGMTLEDVLWKRFEPDGDRRPDIFEFIRGSISVASLERRKELSKRRDHIAEILFKPPLPDSPLLKDEGVPVHRTICSNNPDHEATMTKEASKSHQHLNKERQPAIADDTVRDGPGKGSVRNGPTALNAEKWLREAAKRRSEIAKDNTWLKDAPRGKQVRMTKEALCSHRPNGKQQATADATARNGPTKETVGYRPSKSQSDAQKGRREAARKRWIEHSWLREAPRGKQATSVSKNRSGSRQWKVEEEAAPAPDPEKLATKNGCSAKRSRIVTSSGHDQENRPVNARKRKTEEEAAHCQRVKILKGS